MGILDHVAEQIKQLRPHYSSGEGVSLKKRWPNTSRSSPILYPGGKLACIDIEIWEFPIVISPTSSGLLKSEGRFLQLSLSSGSGFHGTMNNSGIETLLVSTSRSTAANG